MLGEQNQDPNIVLYNSQQEEKYVGMGSGKANNVNSSGSKRNSTLDEPVIETIKRDLSTIGSKIVYVFRLRGQDNQLAELRKNWDLWGPLLISLTMSALVTIGSNGDHEQLFTNLFVVLWLGPLAISVNSRLLGAKIALIQSICLMIYCTSPILVLTVLVFILRLFFRSFVINMFLSAVAVAFTVRGAKEYFKSLVTEDKRYLILYPVILFYVFLVTYISMA